MSKRNDILAGLKESFKNITVVNGFSHDILSSNVLRKHLFVDQVNSFPMIMVVGGKETFEDELSPYSVSNPLSVLIRCYTKDTNDPEVEMCSMISDILKLLDNDTYNTQKAYLYRILSLETDEGVLSGFQDGVAFFEITTEFLYRFKRNTP